MPTISIIIPVFNSAETIVRALDSIKKQLLKDWEVLVVDNGSSDETVKLVNSYISSENRVKLFFSDRGRGVARNFGIKNALGKYLLFLDADDEIGDNMLKLAVDYLESHDNFAAVVTSCIIKNDNNGEAQKKEVYYPFENCLYGLNPFRINSVVLRNDSISNFDTRFKLCEDWLFWVDNLAGKRIKLMPNSYGSVVHITGKNSSTSYQEMLYYQLLVRTIIRQKYPFSSFSLFVKDLKMLIIGQYYNVVPDKLIKNTYLRNCRWLARFLLNIPWLNKKLIAYSHRKQMEYIY